ncbi:DedA family protein [Alicyclobacillus dauci]|uniref:DedA family protein n=1 Tax=Alicyclobacillus dauci TaxID=1475485 RepID=A0ABY6Z1B1_9BACL|nr:DedA family protein [Alicyclobacillus dauci]WAH36672.1 DedA family protein [Alicyclobacillus dauci]
MDQLLIWIQHITSAIVSLGYPGVYVALVLEGLGLPFPGDGFLAFYGYAISEGDMNVIAVLCISSLGYFTGVSIVFGLTRRFGKMLLDPLYRLRVLQASRMDHTSSLMEKYGALILIPGRFLPGIRSLSTFAAALSEMTYSTFTFYTIIGSVAWCGAWIGLGFWFGENVQELLAHVQTSLMWFTIVIFVLLALVWMVKRMQRKIDHRSEK